MLCYLHHLEHYQILLVIKKKKFVLLLIYIKIQHIYVAK